MIEIKCTEKEKKLLIDLLALSEEYCGLIDGGECIGNCGKCAEQNIKWDIQPEPLKPCPCCGGEARRFEALGGMYVKCITCGLRTDFYIAKPEAANRWNRRADND